MRYNIYNSLPVEGKASFPQGNDGLGAAAKRRYIFVTYESYDKEEDNIK